MGRFSRTQIFVTICLTLIVGLQLSFNMDNLRSAGYKAEDLRITRKHLETIKRYLVAYRADNGRYPTNDENLLAIKDAVKNEIIAEKFKYLQPIENDSSKVSAEIEYRGLYFRDHKMFLLSTDAGIISKWGLPYVYD